MKPAAFVLILGVITASLIFSMGEVRGEETALKSFTGLVIYFDDEIIEVKKGKKEVTFYRHKAPIPEKKGEPEKKEAPKEETGDAETVKVEPAICQRVQIWYELIEGKRVVRKFRVISPGYCGP